MPEGFAVIPVSRSSSGEKVAATTAPSVYADAGHFAALLNVPSFKKGDDTKLRSNFRGALTGARVNVFITTREDRPTEIRFRFHDVSEAPAAKLFILWAVSPDKKFVKLGQIVNVPAIKEVELRLETTLRDFGLLITMEDASESPIETPTGPIVGTFHVVP